MRLLHITFRSNVILMCFKNWASWQVAVHMCGFLVCVVLKSRSGEQVKNWGYFLSLQNWLEKLVNKSEWEHRMAFVWNKWLQVKKYIYFYVYNYIYMHMLQLYLDHIYLLSHKSPHNLEHSTWGLIDLSRWTPLVNRIWVLSMPDILNWPELVACERKWALIKKVGKFAVPETQFYNLIKGQIL